MISHTWLLLADSALPLGSFAFSSALESYVAHTGRRGVDALTGFIPQALQSLTTTTLPFVAAAFCAPHRSAHLDDVFDATTTCSVARRASTSQGRALLAVWEKSLAASLGNSSTGQPVAGYRLEMRNGRGEVSGHFAVVWGLVCKASGVTAVEDAVYVFAFNHCRAVVSAAVRMGLVGPYQAQSVLAGNDLETMVKAAVEDGIERSVEDAGQSVPVLDLYQGRHELLYSRVFNS
jgi:urease accessory protein